MIPYCRAHPDSRMDTDGREYGFRADTDKYAYMLRLNPNRGEYNMYIYCYVREWLDRHMANAARGIRFITPEYQDLFRLTDGDSVCITDSSGTVRNRICRYVDETHFECGFELYHICEFAERIAQSGCMVAAATP